MTDYFKNKKNALEYIAMTEGYDGVQIIEQLKRFLKPGSSLLELGMGPGKDIDILKEHYIVTGSDNAVTFLELYKEKNPNADLLELDAVTIQTSRTFDCIFTNKVLHHLSRNDLKTSFARQFELLKPSGLLCHTLWYGDKEVDHRGMKFQYYTENTILNYLDGKFELIYFKKYMEMIPEDSILCILRKCS